MFILIFFFCFFADFSHNRIARIPEMAFENLNNLTYLDLSYNKLKIIEQYGFRPLVNLKTINISGNINLELDLLQNELEVSLKKCIN